MREAASCPTDEASPMAGAASSAHPMDERMFSDPFLPRLADALDVEGMARRIQGKLFGLDVRGPGAIRGRYSVESCRVERTRYAPGQRCSIGYRLVIRDRQTGEPYDHYLCGRVFEPGASRARYSKYRRQSLVEPRFGPPLLHFESLDMIAWSFPNDRKLPALAALADQDRLRREIIPDLVLGCWGADWSVAAFSSSIVSYVHERRCCVRVALRLSHRTSGEDRSWTVYGKMSNEDDGRKIDRTAQQLWHSAARSRGALDLPRPLGYWPEHHLVWQQEVAGLPLAGYLVRGTNTGPFFKAGEVVAALHGTPVSGAEERRIGDVIGRLRERADVICRGWPHHRAKLAEIVERLAAAAPSLERDTLATAHGDLHPRNIIVADDRISLIDLDEAVVGPPLQDISHFVAYLLWEASFEGAPMTVAVEAIRDFVDGYRMQTAWPVPHAELAWYVAAALISEKIFRCVTLIQPGNEQRIKAFIELADRLSRGDSAPTCLEIEQFEGLMALDRAGAARGSA